MTTFRIASLLCIGSLLLASCANLSSTSDSMAQKSAMSVPPGLTDGQPKGKQIRDIYINPTGNSVVAGEAFPDGTVSIMELWSARETANGSLMRDADGRLVKDDLSLIFVMTKSPGAGEKVPEALRNGDWVYAGYKADGVTPGGPAMEKCRTCHLKAAGTDWVFRVDEYLSTRK